MQTQNLNFLTALGGTRPDSLLVIPNQMSLVAKARMKGPQYMAQLLLKEGEGMLNLDAAYNGSTEAYRADLKVDALQLHHFLPKDSIYELTTSVAAVGRGIDFTSYRTTASLKASLQSLHYGRYQISGIEVTGDVKNALATARLVSDNRLLKMNANAEYHLAKPYMDGKLDMDVTQLDLYELGIAPKPLKYPLAFNFTAEARRDRIFTHLTAGDMKLNLSARSSLDKLIKQSAHFADVLVKQIDKKELDHGELREVADRYILDVGR